MHNKLGYVSFELATIKPANFLMGDRAFRRINLKLPALSYHLKRPRKSVIKVEPFGCVQT